MPSSTAAVDTTTTVTAPRRIWTRERIAGVVFVVLGLIAAIAFGSLAPSRTARFTLSENAAGAALTINGQLGAVLFGGFAVGAGATMLFAAARRWYTALLGLAITAFVVSFLCWQVAGKFMPLVDTARGSLELALPLILGALGGVLCERSGVVNVAIEGQFLMGAFAAAMVGTMAASVWAGLVGAAFGGLIIAAILAVLAIRYLVDQVVLGVVLNLFALGLTGFLYERLMQPDALRYNQPPRVPTWQVPGLSSIPVLGPVLFDATIFVYLALGLVIVLQFALFRTRWGLRTRSVGEHPTAADTVGIRVLGVRYRNVLIAGLVAGAGGAYFTLFSTSSFTKNMTSGAGFIALAALIFGRWSPVGAMLAALFFGFTNKLALYLSAIGSPIPSQFLNMLPYAATIIAVAGLIGRVRAPAADGKPYLKG